MRNQIILMLTNAFDRTESIVGRGKNVGYKIFSFSHVSKGLFFRFLKTKDYLVKC